jgi:hypothetical protein
MNLILGEIFFCILNRIEIGPICTSSEIVPISEKIGTISYKIVLIPDNKMNVIL